MKIWVHKYMNRFPYPLLRYIIPRPLLLDINAKKQGFQIYKWLWFGIKIKQLKNK